MEEPEIFPCHEKTPACLKKSESIYYQHNTDMNWNEF